MRKGLLSDLELVEHAEFLAVQNQRDLQLILVHGNKDCTTYEDVNTKERHALPNKYVKAIGSAAAFELVTLDPETLIPTIP